MNPAGSDQCPKHGAETEERRPDRWTRRQTSCLAPQIDTTIKSGLVIFIRLTPRPLTSYTREETNYGCSWVWPGAPVQGNMRCEGWDRGHKSYLHLICGAQGWLTVRQLACALYRGTLKGDATGHLFGGDGTVFQARLIFGRLAGTVALTSKDRGHLSYGH